jgi:hypothetical protein
MLGEFVMVAIVVRSQQQIEHSMYRRGASLLSFFNQLFQPLFEN